MSDREVRRQERAANFAARLRETRPVEETLRAFLEARAKNEPRAHLATGQVARLLQLQDEVSDLWKVTKSQLHIEHVQVTDVSEDEAHADFAATVTETETVPQGTITYDVRYEGPATLRKIEGAWRLANYLVAGRSVAEDLYYNVAPASVSRGMLIEVRAVHYPAEVYLRLENRLTEVVWFNEVALMGRLAMVNLGSTVFPIEIEPGQRFPVVARGEFRLPPLVVRRAIIPFFGLETRHWRHATAALRLDERAR